MASCVACAAGESASDDRTACLPCKPGSERPLSQERCTACKPGFVAKRARAALCSACVGGTFANENSTACITCPKGYYCPRASPNATKCVGASRYCPRGSEAPIVAPAGTYTDALRTTIYPCPVGHYCINGDKRPCPPGTQGNATNLTASTCAGACRKNAHEQSDAGASACSCMPSFVRFDGMCTCAPDMYLSDTTQACAKCPSGLQKENYGTEYADCIAAELSTTGLVMASLVTVAAVAALLVIIMYKRTGSAGGALRVLLHPLMGNIASIFLDTMDVFSDVITCINVLRFSEQTIAFLKPYYVGALVASTATSAYLLYVRVKSVQAHWRHHSREQRVSGGRRPSILRDQSQKVVPDIDAALLAKLDLQGLQNALEELRISERLTYAMKYVMCAEDAPMLVLNAFLVVTVVYNGELLSALARDEPFKFLMMVLAIATSSASFVYKFTKVKDKINVLKRIGLAKKEIHDRLHPKPRMSAVECAKRLRHQTDYYDRREFKNLNIIKVDAYFHLAFDYITKMQETYTIVPKALAPPVSTGYSRDTLDDFLFCLRLAVHKQRILDALPERASDSLADVAAKVVSSGITGDFFSEKIEEMTDVEAGLLAHELVKHHKERKKGAIEQSGRPEEQQ